MDARSVLLFVVAGIFLIIGLVFGLSGQSVPNGPDSLDCGSVFAPDDEKAEREDHVDELTGSMTGFAPDDDTFVKQCDEKRADAKPWAFGGLGLAGVALIVAIATIPRRSQA